MSQNEQAVSLFKEKAQAVAVNAVDVASIQDAIDYAVSVCEQKEFCQLLIPVQGVEPAEGEELPRAKVKTIAAPGLPQDLFDELKVKAEARGIEVIREGVRSRMAGIDVTLTLAEFGLADTGSSVISSSDENAQLATMICESFIVVLPKSKIFPNSDACADTLQELTSKEAAYTSFITGCSRTSDIERVLTLGVHGPLEMHVALLEA